MPFCRSKCSYCDFYSVPVETVPDDYVLSLLKELDYYKSLGLISRLETVYIGGGTPTLLSQEQLSLLLNSLKNFISSSSEVTIEANPEGINSSFLKVALENGINRMSLGIQSLWDENLSCVKRRGNSNCCRKALELLSKAGINYSADMIAGLPPQTELKFQASLKELVSYNPAHISMYALTIEEGTPLALQIKKGQIKYNEDLTDSQWLMGRDFLESAGYYQYEVSNFSKEGFQSRHNCTYWKQESYLGIGAGASGTLYDTKAEGLCFALRYTNTPNVKEYINYWQNFFIVSSPVFSLKKIILNDAPVEYEIINQDTLAFEFYMLGLRMICGVSEAEYVKRFKKKFVHEQAFARWQKRGLLLIIQENDSNRIVKMTKEGLLHLNSFLSEL